MNLYSDLIYCLILYQSLENKLPWEQVNWSFLYAEVLEWGFFQQSSASQEKKQNCWWSRLMYIDICQGFKNAATSGCSTALVKSE